MIDAKHTAERKCICMGYLIAYNLINLGFFSFTLFHFTFYTPFQCNGIVCLRHFTMFHVCESADMNCIHEYFCVAGLCGFLSLALPFSLPLIL